MNAWKHKGIECKTILLAVTNSGLCRTKRKGHAILSGAIVTEFLLEQMILGKKVKAMKLENYNSVLRALDL